MSLLELIKTTAIKAIEARNPVNFILGTVKNANPLEIEVHSKLLLTEDFLIVSEHLTRHDRIVSINYENPFTWQKDKHIGDEKKETDSDQDFTKYRMEYARMTFEDGLKMGDKVILGRVQGGQQFVVHDRYKEGEKVWSYQSVK